jgi:hypothetical protein
MRTFFYGWRRKAGVATLVVACMVMGMWLRSRDRNDWIGLSADYRLILLLHSSEGEIWWQTTQDPHDAPPYELLWWGSSQHGLVPVLPPIEGDDSRAVPTVCVPYWSVVIPLTLLSAFLILLPSGKRSLTMRFTPVRD